MEDYIKNIKSSNGYKYCDVLSNSRRDQILIKISYPRYFYGNNAYLIKTSEECLEVQEHFIERIKKCSLFNNLEGIELTRLDIPFTYIMDEDKRFSDYSNIFKVMGEVYFAKNPKGRPKAFIDLITEEKESLIFTDSKVQSGYNSRIIIYDQYLNLKNKLSEIEFKRAINDFKSLPDRMRIEVSKRIRRTPFSLKEFEEKDFFYYYKKEFKEYLIKTRALAVDMETATIFTVGFANRIPTGALLLISDRPMISDGIKTSESDKIVTQNFVRQHLDIGIETMQYIKDKNYSMRHLIF